MPLIHFEKWQPFYAALLDFLWLKSIWTNGMICEIQLLMVCSKWCPEVLGANQHDQISSLEMLCLLFIASTSTVSPWMVQIRLLIWLLRVFCFMALIKYGGNFQWRQLMGMNAEERSDNIKSFKWQQGSHQRNNSSTGKLDELCHSDIAYFPHSPNWRVLPDLHCIDLHTTACFPALSFVFSEWKTYEIRSLVWPVKNIK